MVVLHHRSVIYLRCRSHQCRFLRLQTQKEQIQFHNALIQLQTRNRRENREQQQNLHDNVEREKQRNSLGSDFDPAKEKKIDCDKC